MTASTLPCRNNDPDLWFPDTYHGDNARTARSLCGQCPVRVACLRRALRNCDQFGIFGGLDPDERARILVRIGRPATPHALETAQRVEQVSRMVGRGIPVREVARQLGIAPETAQRALEGVA